MPHPPFLLKTNDKNLLNKFPETLRDFDLSPLVLAETSSYTLQNVQQILILAVFGKALEGRLGRSLVGR